MNKVLVSLYWFLSFSSLTSSIDEPNKNSEKNKEKIVRIPTLGRPAVLGELYSAYADIFIPGFSLWSNDEIENGTRTIWNPSSHTKFSADESNDEKHEKLDIDAALSGSFKAGLVKVSGAAAYLDKSDDTEETESVTLSFMSIARTESLSSTLLETAQSSLVCDKPEDRFTDKSTQPTHVVASVTYGGDCHMVFERKRTDKKDITDIFGHLKIFVFVKGVEINGHATVNLTDNNTDFMENLSVTMYSDFLLDEQPLSVLDTLKIYRDISKNFGTKESKYNHAVPMFVTLIPMKAFCLKDTSVAVEIGKDILKKATNIRLTLMKVLDKISKLLTSRSAVGNFYVTELLQGFQSDVSKFTLGYEAELQTIIIGARNPNGDRNETELVKLIQNYTSSDYDYDTHLYKYLSKRTTQVNALNIFYTDTILQDVPQIAVETKADIPAALIREPVLFLLTLYVLPNVAEYNYIQWANSQENSTEKKKEEGRWYNNYTTVGLIGHIWRDFRVFFHLNGYEEGQNFFVDLVEEKSEEIMEEKMPMSLTLFIDGIKTNPVFDLTELLSLTTNPEVCRTSKGANISIKVDNPPKRPHPNTITEVLVSITNSIINTQSVFKEPIDQTSPYTIITIPDLVPEYTYNVTVAYVTKYGSLTPSRIYTKRGLFDEMEKTVGCKISRNMMKNNITNFITSTSASNCSAQCHINTNCSDGWMFQLATGNCYFNKAGTKSTQENGWAVGTQSCEAVQMLEDNCSWFAEEMILFLDANNIIDLPSFKKRDCSLHPNPGHNHSEGAVTGMLGGYLITCGGKDKSEYNKTCFSLENGIWVQKPNLLHPISVAASSPDPKNANGVMISGGYGSPVGHTTTETLTPGGKSWIPSVVLPGVGLFQHCQVTLGTTVIITGGGSGGGNNHAIFRDENSTKWISLLDMNQARFQHSCAVLDNTVYVMGGYCKGIVGNCKAEKWITTGNKWKDKWITIDEVPSPMGERKPAFVYENKLYIITDNGRVYSLKDGSTWEHVVDIEQYETVKLPIWPAQVLTASSIGC